MNRPSLIAFDLDGTLAESKREATSEMGELLGHLLEQMPVAVFSGGSWEQFERQLLPALPENAALENLYLFPTSAARCYRREEGIWQAAYDHAFSPEERERVTQTLDEAMRETGFAEPPAQAWGERVEDRGAQITFSALGQNAPIEIKKTWDPDREKRRPLFEALKRRLAPEFRVALNATTSIDITKAGISKAYGLRELSKMAGVPLSDMLYVGDALFPGGNDEVVKETGIPTRQVSGPAETAAVIRALL